MNADQWIVLSVATLVGGLAFGVTGFAYGVVASMFLHHAFTPREVVFLVVSGGTLLNLASLPRFWREIDMRGAAPFLLGATFGLPLGIFVLQQLPSGMLRLVTCAVVISYCVFAIVRHRGEPLKFNPRAGKLADTAIGFAGGVVGGVAGLGPLLPSVWYGLRGKDKVQARGLAQPFGIYVQGLMVTWFLVARGMEGAPIRSMALGIPLMFAGAWLGLRLFDRISVGAFRLCVVWLSLGGALLLLVRQLASLHWLQKPLTG